MENKLCDYGCGLDARFQLKNGKQCCSKSQNSCPQNRKKNSDSVKLLYKNGRKSAFLNKSYSWNKGKRISDLLGEERSKEIFKKVISTKRANGNISSWSKMTKDQKDSFKEQRKKEMNERYAKGWESKAGRCKKYTYLRKDNIEIKVDGTWELLTAFYLDIKGLNWDRNKKRFLYFNEIKQKESFYTPDFYLIDSDSYIEVKGYFDKLSECKLKQFTNKIEIFKKEKIKEFETETGISIKFLKEKVKSSLRISYVEILEDS